MAGASAGCVNNDGNDSNGNSGGDGNGNGNDNYDDGGDGVSKEAETVSPHPTVTVVPSADIAGSSPATIARENAPRKGLLLGDASRDDLPPQPPFSPVVSSAFDSCGFRKGVNAEVEGGDALTGGNNGGRGGRGQGKDDVADGKTRGGDGNSRSDKGDKLGSSGRSIESESAAAAVTASDTSEAKGDNNMADRGANVTVCGEKGKAEERGTCRNPGLHRIRESGDTHTKDSRRGDRQDAEEDKKEEEEEKEESARRVRLAQSLAIYRAQMAAERRQEEVSASRTCVKRQAQVPRHVLSSLVQRVCISSFSVCTSTAEVGP